MFIKYLACSALVLVVGCCGLQEEYVAADRANYEALKPFIQSWVDTDSTLDADDKLDFQDKLIGWNARIERAEKSLEGE